MRLLVLPVQTVSDIITNSSSEVFILNTDKSCNEINTILNTFTYGFRFPEIFSLKEYREWRKKFRNGEISYDEWTYPGTIFEIANGWFKDPEDEEDLFELRRDFLFDPYQTLVYGDSSFRSYSLTYQEPIHESFIKYINDNWDKVKDSVNEALESVNESKVDKLDWKTLRYNHYWMEEPLYTLTKEFLKTYNGPKPTVWEVDKNNDVRNLDGKILVVSENDNSIPYETWDKIKELFNGWNIHLG